MATVILQNVSEGADVALISPLRDVDVSQFEKLRLLIYSAGTIATPVLTVYWRNFAGTWSKSEVFAIPTGELYAMDITVKGVLLNTSLTNSQDIIIVGMTL